MKYLNYDLVVIILIYLYHVLEPRMDSLFILVHTILTVEIEGITAE